MLLPAGISPLERIPPPGRGLYPHELRSRGCTEIGAASALSCEFSFGSSKSLRRNSNQWSAWRDGPRPAPRSRGDTALELLALRQPVAVLKRKRPRPRLNRLDRLFRTTLRQLWPRWTGVLVLVKPETVIGWRRAGFRLYWRRRSRSRWAARRPPLRSWRSSAAWCNRPQPSLGKHVQDEGPPMWRGKSSRWTQPDGLPNSLIQKGLLCQHAVVTCTGAVTSKNQTAA